jgi:hypothetical protein
MSDECVVAVVEFVAAPADLRGPLPGFFAAIRAARRLIIRAVLVTAAADDNAVVVHDLAVLAHTRVIATQAARIEVVVFVERVATDAGQPTREARQLFSKSTVKYSASTRRPSASV